MLELFYEKTMDKENNEVYSKAVRAGKRTYFFDIKTTRGNELYLTITESRKANQDGKEVYQKHKLFLYKEDFDKFSEGLNAALQKVDELNDSGSYSVADKAGDSYATVAFDDL